MLTGILIGGDEERDEILRTNPDRGFWASLSNSDDNIMITW